MDKAFQGYLFGRKKDLLIFFNPFNLVKERFHVC